MYETLAMYIDGQWVQGGDGKSEDVLNPATGTSIGRLPHASRADLDRALEAARKGFKVWRGTSAYDRAKIMRKAADLIRQRHEQISQILTLEEGKILAEARLEVGEIGQFRREGTIDEHDAAALDRGADGARVLGTRFRRRIGRVRERLGVAHERAQVGVFPLLDPPVRQAERFEAAERCLAQGRDPALARQLRLGGRERLRQGKLGIGLGRADFDVHG